nr:PAS domain S-box protein [Myxococcota bacterium]
MPSQASAQIATSELQAVYQALDKAQAIIEFALDGTVLAANENFLRTFGYELGEVVGQHHRIFCEPGYADSSGYEEFWKRLRSGKADTGEFKRLGKDGREVWLQASYNPVLGEDGRPAKIVKFATDVTQTKLEYAEYEGKVQAIDRAQAVIEFELDGTIITANDNFLGAMGYRLEEIVGQHHRIFCEPDYARSADYAEFWQRLGRGEYDTGEFKRLGKDGREIWLQASYNPILDADGRPFKVVKFATDVTASKLENAEYEGKVEAINRSRAVIEFELDGTIITANDKFLDAMGYRLEEIVGQHHRIFCEPDYARSSEYAEFWKRLGRGEYDTGEFKRLGKDGRE